MGQSRKDSDEGHRQEKLWTPVFLVIVGLTLCCFVVGQGSNSGTSVYISRMGGTATLAGMGAIAFSAAAAVARLCTGRVIDTRGRARVMTAGTAILFVGTIVPVIAGHQGDALFIAWRLLQGCGFAMATTASATAAADVLPVSRLGEGIGYYGLGQAIAMSMGPALALYLVSTDPAEDLYLGLSCAAVLAGALGLLCRYEKHPQTLPATCEYRMHWEQRQEQQGSKQLQNEQQKEETARNVGGAIGAVFEKKALPGALPMLLISPAFGFGIFYVGLYGTSLGISSSGLFFTMAAVSMIAVRLSSKSFMDTVSAIKIMAVAVACGLVAYAMLLCAGTVMAPGACSTVYCLAGIPYGVSLGLALPVNQAVAVKNTAPERWGATNAFFLLANDVGIGVASLVWGMVNDACGFTVTMCCVMACIAASLAVAWWCYPEHEKRLRANKAR